ncbi:MAG TPA: glycosyltransferase family 2 protein [Anaerolineales bacterium]|nr:glycosyltransferase family 2 protein [Anaerolineales bacterium]
MPSTPLVSIIIVYWNSAEHLPRCLDCLARQSFQNFEVILIDNGSFDKAVNELGQKYDSLDLRVEHLETNLGFAKANNIGARLARGSWLALLNSDAFPEPDWLEQMLQAADRCPEFSFFSSRQIQFKRPDILDGSGDEYHISGLAWRRFYNHPANMYGRDEEEVFSACAAAAVYNRNDFLQVGGFDESYFSYFEDVDLSFRLRLAGGRCLYVPQAVVYHVGSASSGKTSDFVIYHGHRNLVWTFFKDMPGYLFWCYLPLHILMNFFFVFLFLLLGEGPAILRAKIDAFHRLPAIISQRRQIQGARKASAQEIAQLMNRDLFASYQALRRRHNRTS